MNKVDEVFENVIKFFACSVPKDERSKELFEKLLADSKSENNDVKFVAMAKLMKMAKDVLEQISDDVSFGITVRNSMKNMINDINKILSNELKNIEDKDSFYFN